MSHFVSEPSPMELSPATSAQLVPLAPISLWLKLGKDEMYLSETWCGCQLSFNQLPSTLPADHSSLPARQEMLQLETLLIKHKNLIQTQTAGQAFPTKHLQIHSLPLVAANKGKRKNAHTRDEEQNRLCSQ